VAAGLGDRLVALLDAGAIDATLVSATVPAPSIDAISLVAAAVEADLEVALWLRPWEGTAFVGVGRAWATIAAWLAFIAHHLPYCPLLAIACLSTFHPALYQNYNLMSIRIFEHL
jgi:hypothetical protein